MPNLSLNSVFQPLSLHSQSKLFCVSKDVLLQRLLVAIISIERGLLRHLSPLSSEDVLLQRLLVAIISKGRGFVRHLSSLSSGGAHHDVPEPIDCSKSGGAKAGVPSSSTYICRKKTNVHKPSVLWTLVY